MGISLLAEMNLNWNMIKPGHKWFDRVRQVTRRGHFSSVSFNSNQDIPVKSAFQWGGCSATLLNEVAHSSRSSGADPTGLGRWAWVKLRGRSRPSSSDSPAQDSATMVSKDLVVLSAYRPNRKSPHSGSVWMRQRLHWLSAGLDIDPREKFTLDLMEEIEKWRSEGCEIILGIDANEDLSLNHPTSFRQLMRNIGLTEAILARHHGPYPATQQANSSNSPIDGIFVSPGVAVLGGGYLDFHQYFQSDHRGIWLDINLDSTLGRVRPQRAFPTRRLNTLDGRSVRRYLSTAEAGYLEFDIPRRLAHLHEDLVVQRGRLTLRQTRAFNCLHQQAYEIRRKAEKSCRKFSKGGVPWSPRLQKMWDRLRLFDLLLKGHKGLRTSSRKIRRLLKKTGLTESWKLSESELQTQLAAERNKYNKAKSRRSKRLRRYHVIDVRSSAPARAKRKSAKQRARSSRVQRMLQKEETRRRRKAQGKGFSGGLVRIQVAGNSTASSASATWTTCSTQRLVEEGCMRENQERYDQTRFPFPTPPMAPPLYSMFNGPEAESNSRQLLDGSLPVPSSDPILASFFNHCRRPAGLVDQPLHVSLDDHVSFWSRMSEHKGSEPHGLHNGHYKAGATSPLLSQCDTVFRSIPFDTGFVPDQWRHLTNFAIEKKPGEIRVTKMRTIQMMNSEFQANNKKVGKAAMAYAERHNLIPPGQCGARKAHQAIDLALSKRLVWDLLLLQRRAAGWVSNDAKSCFDRIVHWVAIISLMRFGIDWTTLRSMFDTLMLSAHRVRTGFGDCARIFSPPSRIPFQGCGQGNGAGPTIWVAVSSILLGMMITRGFGFEFLSALSWTAVIANCFAFIDDTDISQAASSVEQSGEELLAQVQQALHWWSSAIRLSGGALSPSKSFWWLIDFKWDSLNGRWSFKRHADFEHFDSIRLVTPDLDGKPVPLPWLEPDQSERTLGVMMAPLSRPDIQLAILKEKASKWASTVKSGRLLPYDVLPLLKSTIMKSVEYPMALTTFTAKQWEKLMSPVLMTLLPKAGICRSFPRAVVYAPLRFQGLGIPHPFAVQMTKHLDMLLRHPANRTATASFLEANVQAHQLETGTSFGIFQQVYDNTAILASDTWVKRVWRSLDAHDVHVELDSPPLALRREGDCLLMELFMDAKVDQQTLLWLNWCRMFLHAVTLSDIVTADGSKVTTDAWTGRRDSHCLDRYQWPRTRRPSSRWWDLWRYWLSKTVLGPSEDRSLAAPLGPWLDDDGKWRWKFSPSTGRLFHLEGGGWVEAQRSSRAHGRNFRLPRAVPPGQLFSSTLPADCTFASVSRSSSSHTVTFLGFGLVHAPSPPPTSLLGYHQHYAAQIDGHHGWVPEHLWIQGDEQRLRQALVAGELRVVCDGSYKDQLGSACSQLRTVDGRDIIWILCQTPGLPDDQSSTRSELAGILASVIVLEWLCLLVGQHRQRQSPSVTIACDGLVALQKCFYHYTLHPSSAQFDMSSTIRAILHSLPLSVQGRHVQGHADRKKHHSKLDWWELRNGEVDVRAQQFRESLFLSGRLTARNPRFFSEPAALFIRGVKRSSLSLPLLLETLAEPLLHTYWSKQRSPRISPAQFDIIDWPAMSRAMKSFPPALQRWTSKHTVGICGVGKFRRKWGVDMNASCPRCKLCDNEDHLHVVRCTGKTAVSAWRHAIRTLSVWLAANNAAPELSKFLLRLLQSIRDPSVDLSVRRFRSLSPAPFRLAVEAQLSIGAQGLLEGLLSTHWRHLQQDHFDRSSSASSVPLWISRLVQQLILVGRHMWMTRNDIYHSEDNSRYDGTRFEVDQGIRDQYHQSGVHDAPPQVRSMLKQSMRSTLRLPLENRKAWLCLAQRERTRFRRSLARQRGLLKALFRRRAPPCSRVTRMNT